MKRICPNPLPWVDVVDRLTAFAKMRPCSPPSPPAPLVLGGWAYSNDVEKMRRWDETVAWAHRNGCSHLVDIPAVDFYYSRQPTSYASGPIGGPMYREWEFQPKERPTQDELVAYIEVLSAK